MNDISPSQLQRKTDWQEKPCRLASNYHVLLLASQMFLGIGNQVFIHSEKQAQGFYQKPIIETNGHL